MQSKKKKTKTKSQGSVLVASANPRKKAEKCCRLAVQALKQEDYETAYRCVEQGLKVLPGFYPLINPAYQAIVALKDPKKTFFVLKQSWKHGYEKTKVNIVVLGTLAFDYEEYELCVEALSAVLASQNTYSGTFQRGQKSYAQRLLSRARGVIQRSKQASSSVRPRPTPAAKTSQSLPEAEQQKKHPERSTPAISQESGPSGQEKDPGPDQDIPALEMVFQEETIPDRAMFGKEQVSSATRLELALWGYRLSFRSSFDQLLCLAHVKNIHSYWYQEETARKAMKNHRGRALLADEVGLGKTIEACLILKEYIMRGLVRNALVLAPSSLVDQWQEELHQKFSLSFVTSSDPLFKADPQTFWSEPFLLVSLQTARTRQHFEQVTSRSYDLVIVDEAHHLKNRTTRNWKLVNAIQKSFLLLLSATPVQNKLEELYNVITLLKPGHLSTVKAFKEQFVARGNPTDPRNRETLRQLLKEVMIRNTRAATQVKLPPRFASTVKVAPSAEEKAFYDLIQDFVLKQSQQEENRDLSKMALRRLLQAAGSSPFAALQSLQGVQKTCKADLQPAIQQIIKLGDRIHVSSKMKRVLELIQSTSEQKVVFVNAAHTLDCLDQWLTEQQVDHVALKGGLSKEQRRNVLQAFEQGCPLMLSMDSGGEGHNLQFCRFLINYDLPWNPMQIEQRIGRVHRIGQEQEVYIYNFCAKGSLEDSILDVLDKKINMFELVIGEMEMILGRLQGEQEFSDMVYELWTSHREETSRQKAFESLGTRLKRARSAHEKTKELDEKLFQDDFGV